MNRTTTNLPVYSLPVNYRFIFLNFIKPNLPALGKIGITDLFS